MRLATIIAVFLFSCSFTFRVQNNTDRVVYFNLHKLTVSGYFPIMGGELDPGESMGGGNQYTASNYKIDWSERNGDWLSKKWMEIDDSVTADCTVNISLNDVPIEVFIER